jgi:hypothetical protein
MRIILSLILLNMSSLVWAHAEESNTPSRVGPDKGVVEVHEDEGFVLRPSVESNFSIQKNQLKAGPAWTVPTISLIHSGLETQVMRQRADHWKSVDVEVRRKSGGSVEIRSKDLRAGDFIATGGVGFLKIIEQSVMAPHADAHDH